MGLEGSGTMLKKLGALTIALIIISASSMSVFAGNTDSVGTPSRILTGTAITSGGALSKTGSTTPAAVSEETKSNRLSTAAFEAALDSALRNGRAEDNGEFILDITKPKDNKESYYEKAYPLTGTSLNGYDDVVVSIARYNDKTGEYELMTNTDGESSWSFLNTYSKEISLVPGANKIKILAYRKSQMDEPKFQINCYTIEYFNEKIPEKVVKKNNDIASIIGEDINEIGKQVTNMIDLLSGKAK